MFKSWIKLVVILATLLILSSQVGCSLHLISEYDRASQQHMLSLMKKIDGFYLHMSNVEPAKRKFSHYSSGYTNIEVEINALLQRQKVRELNELTVKQVEILLELWQQGKLAHKTKDSISDFIIKRRRSEYQRVMLAMVRGEESKAQ
ncbi:hypothetical protein A7985_21910 [Pseudoalteromonas luteoviolacea]|uniref:Uncharacterized protein n=1 Tax=Pseudoalteromonas luteoviolacea TaxID=43657 RepID=A0A1C0TKY1_9GAMM|nr:hypothetical protein [Pseudoalteromonas luteoviolacea]MBQ4813112.1 hypothetical protein [Pseudoalteromonas luteoviolacea]OCQ19103.1 hypothetical protein A7985_21910 [Pseudoalteromonas luteoviolacea]